MNISGKLIEISPEYIHFGRVLELDQTQFPRPWTARSWTSLNWSHHFLLGWENQGLEAFCLFSLVAGDDAAHLLKICVRQDLRGSGLAPHFWLHCLEWLHAKSAKSVFLEVEASNSRAIQFYQKQGFSTLRLIKGYYSDGGDAVSMLATI